MQKKASHILSHCASAKAKHQGVKERIIKQELSKAVGVTGKPVGTKKRDRLLPESVRDVFFVS